MNFIDKLKKNFLLRKILFKIIYFSRLFRVKEINVKKFDHIVLLGKGESLLELPKRIKKLDRPNVLILSNFNSDDLDNKKLFNIVKKFPIILHGNITEPFPRIKILKKLKIFRIYIQRIKMKNNLKVNSSLYSDRKNYIYDALTSNVFYLPNFIHFFHRKINKKLSINFNTGILSILLACSFKPKKITMFGYDFYETPYFNKPLLNNMSKHELKNLLSLSNSFSRALSKIALSYPKISFSVFTKSKKRFINKKNFFVHKL